MAYTVYDPNASQNDYNAAHQRLLDIMGSRQNFTNQMYQQQQDDLAKQQADAAAAEHEGKLNWQDDLEKGAQSGAAFGPWGALVGGIVGAAKGQFEAIKERTSHGQNFFSAAGNTMFDDPFGITKKAASSVGIKNDGSHLKLGSGIGAAGLGNLAGMGTKAYLGNQARTTGSSAPSMADLMELKRQNQAGDWGNSASQLDLQQKALARQGTAQDMFYGDAAQRARTA